MENDVKVITKTMDKNKSKLSLMVENIEKFAKNNTVLAGGFVSGFLIGFAFA